jgi:hypothetical protein
MTRRVHRDFAIADVPVGQLNALVKRIMQKMLVEDPLEAVRLVNSGEWIVTRRNRSWREKDGVVYLTVTSNGRTAEEWVEWFEARGDAHLCDLSRRAILSSSFKPTKGVTYEVGILKGMLFKDEDRFFDNILSVATLRRKLVVPSVEAACLIRELLTNDDIEDMGLNWIIVMHERVHIPDCDCRCRLFINGCGSNQALSMRSTQPVNLAANGLIRMVLRSLSHKLPRTSSFLTPCLAQLVGHGVFFVSNFREVRLLE